MKKRWFHRVEALKKAWDLRSLVRKHGKQGVLVACSGGVDSVALFHLLKNSAQKAQICLGLVHVNYALRGLESDLDEEFVRQLARDARVPCFVHRVDATAPRANNTQAWAREVRYKFFSELAEKGWLVALAHHSDDLAETFLLRAARGAAVAHLAGLREWAPPCYWRPLLRVSKSEISEWLSGQDLPHREDSSNAKMIYGRNRVRSVVLTTLEDIHEGATRRLARLALELQEEGDAIRSWLWGLLGADVDRDQGRVIVANTKWLALPFPLLRESLSVLCERGFSEVRGMTHAHLEELGAWLQASALKGKVGKYEKQLPQGLQVTLGVAHTEFKLILVQLI